MADTLPSTNMGLPIPVAGVDAGPDYALNVNNSLTLIDGHDHSSGKGVPINPSGLNINSDLPFLNNNLTLVRSVRFISQVSPLSLPTDIGCLYESGLDLYYNDGAGNQVRITQSGGVAGSPGSIANLTSPASATYVSGTETFVWQSAANKPANLDAAYIILRNNSVNSKGLTLKPPTAMGANYTVTLPALPGVTNIMTIDSSGNMGSSLNVDNSTIEISGNTLQVKDAGITPEKLSPLGEQISSSSGAFNNTNTGFIDVTNLTVTITTTGRPIFVGLMADGNMTNPASLLTGNTGGQTGRTTFQILNASTPIAVHNLEINGTGIISGATNSVPSSSLWAIDVQAAGTYTYKVQGKIILGDFWQVNYSKLIAYEL